MFSYRSVLNIDSLLTDEGPRNKTFYVLMFQCSCFVLFLITLSRFLSQSQLIRMRQRWARGPTPPLPNDEDDDDITGNRRRDSGGSSDAHRHGDSPAHQTNGTPESPANGDGVSPAQPTRQTDSVSSRDLESERDSSTGRLVNGGNSHHNSSSNSQLMEEDIPQEEEDEETGGGRECEQGGETGGRETCGEGAADFEDLLMRESDIVREREGEEEEEDSRKRDRDSHGSPDSDRDAAPSGSREQAKKQKLTNETDREMEDLLEEEEQFMMVSVDHDIPSGFNM